ncbi:MAG: hypothetical protein II794_00515 [Oscillospiraceae bacterium]|nr:hypothetical protein [Oscillospiraceae bacterium]
MKKAIILILCALLISSCLPALALPEEIKAGDILCFGTPDEASGFDGRWIVLDPEHTSTGGEGMLLLSLSLVGSESGGPLVFRDIGDVSVSFSDRGDEYAKSHPGVTDYRGSDIQLWCEAFPEKYLSEAEAAALIPTWKSDDAIVIPGFSVPLPGAANGTVDFDPAPEVLQGDRVFILSVEEATKAAYGLGENRDRVAYFKGEAGSWWLRSPHIPTFPLDVGFVFPFGAVMDYPVNARSMYEMVSYARPACNLDSSRITALEKLGEENGKTLWRASFGPANALTYDTALPVVGQVLDLAAAVRIVFALAIIIPLLILALIIFLIVRHVRKKRRAP